jgi:hypothetical protein
MTPEKTVMAGSAAGERARRSFAATNLFLHKQLWIWPILAAIVLLVIGLWVRGEVEKSQKQDLSEELNSILSANVEALEIWMKAQRSNATTAADATAINTLSRQLVALGEQADITPVQLLQSPTQRALREAVKPWLATHGYNGFIVADRSMKIVGSSFDDLVGREKITNHAGFVERAFSGQSTVSHPFPSTLLLPDDKGRLRTGLPAMYAAAPVRDEAGNVVAALALRIHPETDFTRILQVARKGRSGETYVFDRTGKLLSESRFDDVLKETGLIPDDEDARSILTLILKDPQVDLTTGARPPNRRSEQPLTRPVAAAVSGTSDVDVEGYRDYRGVPSIAAWRWLPEFEFGVVTEVDKAEAYQSFNIIRTTFWGLFGLLAACSLAIFAFTLVSSRLQQRAQQANLLARQLGQYTLDELIGAGGMGVVYRAHHALLRRPTAVKLLNQEKTTETALRRFEREVQITSRLNHPNTIVIYDYGRTPEGIFYYAMEFLEGIDLEKLVKVFGPQPERRVVDILKQVCGSLAEAHGLGLIHRDIKPANIVLNRRGGLCDFVKVLDFGLVKALDSGKEATLTAANCITGTPLYMSPESIDRPDQVDARSDLYAVGAVGYFLLTGMPVFHGENVYDLLKQQATALPQPPSQRLRKSVSADLELLLLKCLAKSAADRPVSARELGDLLDRCQVDRTWTAAAAEVWWDEFEVTTPSGTSISPTGTVRGEPTAVTAKAEIQAS